MPVFFTARRAPRAARQEMVNPGLDPLVEALKARMGGRRPPAAVTWDSALGVPAVWMCVALIADVISTLPVDAYRTRDGASVEMTKPPVLTTPGGEGVGIDEWLAASQVSLELRGNAYGLVVARDGLGFPRQIELQHPDTVQIRRNRHGALVYRVAGKVVDTADVWHERHRVVPGSPVGLSPIAMAATAVGMNIAAEDFGAAWFCDGAHPTGLLTQKDSPTITQAQATIVKERFLASTSGTREPAVLGGGWDYTQLQVAPNESQFLEAMQYGDQQVARLFSLSPEMIGAATAGSSVTYANVEQRAIDALKFAFGPRITRRENALSRLLPAPQRVKLNRGALLATDLLTRYRSYEVGIRAKFLAQDEARALEDRQPLTPEQVDQLQNLASTSAPPTPVVLEP